MVLAECLGSAVGLDIKRTGKTGQIPVSYSYPGTYAAPYPGYAPATLPYSYPYNFPYPASAPNASRGNLPQIGYPPLLPYGSNTLPLVALPPVVPVGRPLREKMTQRSIYEDESDESDMEEELSKPKRPKVEKVEYESRREHNRPRLTVEDEDEIARKVLDRAMNKAALTSMGLTPQNLATLYGPNTAMVERDMGVHQLGMQQTLPYTGALPQQSGMVGELQTAAELITSWAASDAQQMANMVHMQVGGGLYR